MNPMFDRLSLQGHLRRIIEQYGESQGLDLIKQAIERELKSMELRRQIDIQD